MRLLIFPNFSNPYDIRMTTGLGRAFTELGILNFVIKSPINENFVNILAKSVSADVVLRINRTRPDNLDKNIRHLSWFQDYDILNNFDFSKFLGDDILYSTAPSERFGIDLDSNVRQIVLPLGIDYDYDKNLNNVRKIELYDFGLAGFLPAYNPDQDINKKIFKRYHFSQIIRKFPILGNLLITRIFSNIICSDLPFPFNTALNNLVDVNYKPLTGSLDIKLMEKKMLDTIKIKISDLKKYNKNYRKNKNSILNVPFNYLKNSNYNVYNLALKRAISWSCREYPRYLDRIKLINLCEKVSSNIAIVGSGWEASEFSKYCKGVLKNEDLTSFYSKCKINLCNNTHGIGIAQTRILEIMMSKGFVLSHTSKYDKIIGGLLHYFEEERHLATFNNKNFSEIAAKWLKNKNERYVIAENGYKYVKENHTWLNRAKQILKDLKK